MLDISAKAVSISTIIQGHPIHFISKLFLNKLTTTFETFKRFLLNQFSVSVFLKILFVFGVSCIRIAFAPALSFGLGLDFLQTLISTIAGGITGVVIFFFFSRFILVFYKTHLSERFHRFKVKMFTFLRPVFPRVVLHFEVRKPNRRLIRFMLRLGLAGIVILTPVLLSIPLGTFLAIRYYPSERNLLPYLCASVVFWSFFMSSAFSLF